MTNVLSFEEEQALKNLARSPKMKLTGLSLDADWIDANDAVPDIGQTVAVLYEGEELGYGRRAHDGDCECKFLENQEACKVKDEHVIWVGANEFNDDCPVFHITHWLPLPKILPEWAQAANRRSPLKTTLCFDGQLDHKTIERIQRLFPNRLIEHGFSQKTDSEAA